MKVEWFIEHPTGAFITLLVEADVTWGRPAKLWGDDPYPEEPDEAEISGITDSDGEDYLHLFSEAELRELEENAVELAHEQYREYQEMKADVADDLRRDEA